MSQRQSQRGRSMAPYEPPVPARKQRGRCLTALCMSWKAFTFVFSHVMLIALVISYCILGAFTFQELEAENEKNVRMNVFCINFPS